MTTKMKLTQIAAAVGLALAFSPAMADITVNGIQWNDPPQSTTFEDDDFDFALEVNVDDPDYNAADPGTWKLRATTDNTLDVGDVLLAVAEFNTNQGDLDDRGVELTGISLIQYAGTEQVEGLLEVPGGDPIPVIYNTLRFVPYEGGFNLGVSSATGLDIDIGASGDEGGGAMLALWLDDDLTTLDMNINATFLPDGISCYTLQDCAAQASDGALWQVDGLAGEWSVEILLDDDGNPTGFVDFTSSDDAYWYALGTGNQYDVIRVAGVAAEKGSFNAGLSILVNGTGVNLASDAFTGDLLGNGEKPVDMLIGGTLKGGGVNATDDPDGLLDTLVEDGYVATSDADMQKTRAVPEPGTLALLAAGLLGGIGLRRRKA